MEMFLAGVAVAAVGASRVEGAFAIKDASLRQGVAEGTCDPEDATVAIVTEEGTGRCFYYLYATVEEAEEQFSGPDFAIISRIMFTFTNGTIRHELKHGGFRMAYRTIRRAIKNFNVCGKIFVNARYGQFGVASYHFVNEKKAYISFASELCSLWLLDDGRPMPREKHFQEISYDSSKKIFRGVIDWSPTSFCGDQRWEHEMVFDEGFECIMDGHVHHFTPEVSDRHSKEQVLYYKGAADDSANVLSYNRWHFSTHKKWRPHSDCSSTASNVDVDDRQWDDLDDMIENRLRMSVGSPSSLGSFASYDSGRYTLKCEELGTDFLKGDMERQISLECEEDNMMASPSDAASLGNEMSCAVCNASVGKCLLSMRHHCRACGKCVCSACSPHSASLPGGHGFQRVCTPCMNTLQEVCPMRQRLSTCSTSLSCKGDSLQTTDTSISVLEDLDVSSDAASSGDSDRTCAVCTERLGKRFLRPRHHCRACKKAVCGGCSPNSVVLPGMQGLQRVCTPCMILPTQGARSPRPSIDSEMLGSDIDATFPEVDETVQEYRSHVMDPFAATVEDDSDPKKETSPSLPSNCAICNARLGKRYFRLRHRCRACSRFVCGECSPNSVVLPGTSSPQRVCTPCVAISSNF